MRPLAHQLDLARPPGLVKECLQWAVEAQDRKPSLARQVWIQLPRLTPAGWVGLELTVVEPSVFGSAAGDG